VILAAYEMKSPAARDLRVEDAEITCLG
jgi:hypothetical protein